MTPTLTALPSVAPHTPACVRRRVDSAEAERIIFHDYIHILIISPGKYI